MKKYYQKPKLQLVDKKSDFIIMSGDGYVNDPWSEGLGGEL